MPDPNLADLDAFVAVARARSFRGAAKLRGVSPSALSEALRRLEARLALRLLNRTTRSVTPTEAGTRLLEQIEPAMREIASALDTVGDNPDRPAGTLRINAPTVVARHILPGLVSRFLTAYPGIAMEIEADDSFIDVLGAGFDAGIRYEESVERDMIAVPIGPETQRFVLAGAPRYLDAHGWPTHPRELVAHACIRHRFASGVTRQWEFERGRETLRIAPSGPLIATTVELEIRAAIEGLGLVCTFEEYLREAIAAGRLVPLLEDWAQTFSGPRLYYANRRHMPAALRAFLDFIKEDRRQPR